MICDLGILIAYPLAQRTHFGREPMNLKQISIIATLTASVALCGQVQAGSGTTSSCATPDNNVPVSTCYFDLTAAPSSTPNPPLPPNAVLNGGIFSVPASNSTLGNTIVGTGVFQPFVRIQVSGNGQSDNVEAGFNSGINGPGGDPSVKNILDNHDQTASNWNHALQLGNIGQVTVCDGGGSTGSNCKQYLQFLLDVNEQGNSPNSGISLDEFKVFTSNVSNLTGTSGCTGDVGQGGHITQGTLAAGYTDCKITGANQVYNMDAGPGGDASILMDYSNFSGSGNGVDLQALVPVSDFLVNGVYDPNQYVYLYSKFGATGTTCQTAGACVTPTGAISGGTAGTLNFGADAGFEEWSTKTAKVPLPATAMLFLIGLAGLGFSRRKVAIA
jgi:hypothetical protein